ncbi:unnamed protein product [Fusarium graminearum]|uniref:Chromosome 1, complete genome n=1 Tax=Gibberella zeae (strain ATCC MYA-4620 / CBS 123657 / FGSC 9075 / NRRL 31084 / PH-1) TaxID=229533 RepID=A0A0E0RVK5_GIBZE|nr:hypothetical protein FG05_30347 [Fusarium graminearum]CEF75280.1 unnamed protein product [Fusarium graminearum]CZS78561.1 unnamed protein product [Fusarium graminearum]
MSIWIDINGPTHTPVAKPDAPGRSMATSMAAAWQTTRKKWKVDRTNTTSGRCELVVAGAETPSHHAGSQSHRQDEKGKKDDQTRAEQGQGLSPLYWG